MPSTLIDPVILDAVYNKIGKEELWETALEGMIEGCMGLRDTADARRREADDYRKKELCAKVKRLWAFVAVSTVAGALLMLLSPWFALSWAVRLVLAVAAVVYAYNVKSDIYEEAEKIL